MQSRERSSSFPLHLSVEFIEKGAFGLPSFSVGQLIYKYVYTSTLNSKPLNLDGYFTYLNSNISSTESNINIWIRKAWTAINRLSIIWKSDLSDKKKTGILQSCSHVSTIVWLHSQNFCKKLGEKAKWELHKNAALCFE